MLPQLPSLTQIEQGTSCERFEWLRSLPNLTDVCLTSVGEEAAAGRADSLVAGLQSCAAIQILTLRQFRDLTPAHLAELLPRLPRLRELSLISVEIDSLAFLSQPPLTSRLSSLVLNYCRRLQPAELRHVHSLRGLRSLELRLSLTAPLDADGQRPYTPPSILLPQLRAFSYSPPEEFEEENEDDGNGDGEEGGE